MISTGARLPCRRREEGYVLILAMLVLMILGSMAMALVASVQANQQHVSRDRAYTQSLAVAEAGLNQYLWMVATGKSSETNDFAIAGNTGSDIHKETITLADRDDVVKGTYTIQVMPPTGSTSNLTVKVTGTAAGGTDAPRTVSAHIGRPAFSEYILLVDDQVYIGGPLTRVWYGKTHSNEGIRIETAQSTIRSRARSRTTPMTATDKPGIWSDDVPIGHSSRAFWSYPVPVSISNGHV